MAKLVGLNGFGRVGRAIFRILLQKKYVDVVVPQETYSPLPNAVRIKPDILMESASHGEAALEEARKTMDSIGGRVIVTPYYPGQSSTNIKQAIKKNKL